MNFDSFLGEKRWEILERIAKKPSSPMELAESLLTTVSYISQQLKLLEAAGIIFKLKTGAVEKGKPRNLYSISKEFVYLINLSKDFSEKKLLYLTPYHKSVLMIWSLEDSELHEPMQKLFFKLKDKADVEAIYLDKNNSKFIIVSHSKELKLQIETFIKSLTKKINFSVVQSIEKNSDLILLG